MRNLYKIRKILFIAIAFILISIGLTSCYMDNRKEKRILSGELNIITCNEYKEYIDKAVQEYSEYHKGVNINVETFSQEEISDAISSNDKYDLITFPSIDMQKYKDNLEDINPYIKDYIDDFDKEKLKLLKIDNELKGFPIDLKAVGIYYRKDILKDLGVSELDINTWDKFINLGKTLKDKKGIKLISVNTKGENSIYTLLINQLLEDFTDNEENLNFSDDVSLRAFNMIKQLKDLDIINFVDDNSTPMENTLTGKTLCFIGSNTNLVDVEKYVSQKKLEISLGINKIPAFEPGGNRSVISVLNNIGILKTSKNKDVAKDFLNVLLTNKDVLIEGINNYMIPIYKPAYFNDAFDKEIQVLDNERGLRKFEYITREAYVRKVDLDYELIDNFICSNLQNIIKNNDINKNIKSFQDNLSKMIQESMKIK